MLVVKQVVCTAYILYVLSNRKEQKIQMVLLKKVK